MDDDNKTRRVDDRATTLWVGATVVLSVTFMVLVFQSLERNGVQRTLIFTAVVLSCFAAFGALLGLVHLAWIATRREDRRQVRWHISLALVSGLIIGLAVWVPQQLLEGKLDDILEAAEEENEQSRASDDVVQDQLDAVLVESQLTQIESQPIQRDADLVGEDLTGARLSEIDFTGSDLSYAGLDGATLMATVLTDARLFQTRLQGANLEKATLLDADLRKAILDDAMLAGADLSGADLRDASLIGASLRDAVLSGAALEGADLSGTDLEDANVTSDALESAALDAETRCPDGSLATADEDGAFRCAVPMSQFMLRTDLVDDEAIPVAYTCDGDDPGPPAIGWREAPDGGEAVIALTRADEILWLVAVPREPVRGEAPLDGSETILREYTPPCPPLDEDGVGATTQSFVLTLYVVPMPLARDGDGTVLGTAREVLDGAIADATAHTSVTGGYARLQV